MRRYRCVALIIILALIAGAAAYGSEYKALDRIQKDAGTLDRYLKKGGEIAYRITELTGVALSPLVGLVVIGGIEHYKAKKEGGPISWYFSLWFLATLVLILVLITLKDTIGEAAPFLKKPLDALDFVQHKFSGILAFAIVGPQLVLSILAPVEQAVSFFFDLAGPAGAWAAGSEPTGMAGVIGVVLVGAIVVSSLVAALFFVVILLAAGAVESLILLAPIPFVGLILRGFRLSILGLLGLGAAISPVIGVVLSLAIFYVSYRILGWSFRLSVFGWVLVYDPLTGQRNYVDLTRDAGLAAFSAPEFAGVRNRTYGRLSRRGESLVFEYRPWLILPKKRAALPEPPERIGVARGTLFPSVVALGEGHRRHPALCNLPPRYKGHEEDAARSLGLSGEVHDQRFHRRLSDAWRWIRGELTGGSPAAQPA
jgi:hypothetical protein